MHKHQNRDPKIEPNSEKSEKNTITNFFFLKLATPTLAWHTLVVKLSVLFVWISTVRLGDRLTFHRTYQIKCLCWSITGTVGKSLIANVSTKGSRMLSVPPQRSDFTAWLICVSWCCQCGFRSTKIFICWNLVINLFWLIFKTFWEFLGNA